MINNRQNGRNNRRGRGGPRPMGGSGGGGQGPRPDAGNRMDSRQRGNASQLHEKYKNLARDAQTQGDRVTAEYYLQFADHYFRVLNEHRARQEEFRERQEGQREGQRERPRQHEQRYDDDGEDDGGDDMRNEDATAPIAISGLPPAIGAASAASDGFDDDQSGDEDESEQDSRNDRQPRGRGRGRPPRQADGWDNADRQSEQPSPARQDQSEETRERAERPVRRRAPRETESGPQLELTVTTSAESDDAPKPRRRLRRAPQEQGDPVS